MSGGRLAGVLCGAALFLAASSAWAFGHPLKVGLADMCPTNGAVIVQAEYVDAVAAVGDVPVVLPRQSDTNRISRLMDGIDVLLLCGGADVDPARYGESPSPKLGTVNAVRDKINELQPGFEEILETTAGCTVTSHCGPGTLGVLFVRKA